MKKRIAVVAPDLSDSGGVQSIVEMLVRQIEESEAFECSLISLATSASDSMSVRMRDVRSWFSGVRCEQRVWRGRSVTHVGCLFSEFEFMRYRQRKLLSELLKNHDVIQVIGGFGAWSAAVSATGLPVSVWAATRCAWERVTQLQGSKGWRAIWRRSMTFFTERIERKALIDADKVLVMNPWMASYVESLTQGCPERVVYAPPGVDIKWFVPRCPLANDSASSVKKYILAVGRFSDPRKNPDRLLEAFSKLPLPLAQEWHLILAGATGPSDAFWQTARQMGLAARIEFRAAPDQEMLRELYQSATCVALSSNEEGFGMVLVEAMACGIPVVATRCGGPQGIISDGHDGFLVGINDVDQMTAQLTLLCADVALNKIMGAAARRTVEMKFSEEASGRIFLKTWVELDEKRQTV